MARTRDPWAVLVSEVMLQQTQVERVVGALRALPRRVPHARRLRRRPAPAGCVRQWSGLGYNRRALSCTGWRSRSWTSTAGGSPTTTRRCAALPGVGPYTARAVRSSRSARTWPRSTPTWLRALRCVAAAPSAPARRPASGTASSRRTVLGSSTRPCSISVRRSALAARPHCDACPLRRQCRWPVGRSSRARPVAGPAGGRRQATFAGSDRQGRGRLLEALRRGTISEDGLAQACGWPDDPARAGRTAGALVAEGFAAGHEDA